MWLSFLQINCIAPHYLSGVRDAAADGVDDVDDVTTTRGRLARWRCTSVIMFHSRFTRDRYARVPGTSLQAEINCSSITGH